MNIQDLCPHCLKEVKGKSAVKICPYCKRAFEERDELQHQLPPETILAGKYLIGDVLGEGGFGITYVGFDLNLEMRVAVKEFYPNGYATREAKTTTQLTIYSGVNEEAVKKWRENFIREARNLAKCSNLPGIVGVKDFFQANNTAYIILEFVEGKTLKEYAIENGGTLPEKQLIAQLQPVIEALGEVHKTGIVHRDISPDNLMIMPDGKIKLIDFGAARDFGGEDAKSLSVMLKPGYAPEEQYRSKGKQGPWSDVYALAGTIYKCITGVTPPEAVERIQKDELVSLSKFDVKVSPQVETALLKALSVFAENRYQTMEEFAEALYGEQLETAVPPQETKETRKKQEKKDHAPEDPEKKMKRIRMIAIAGAAVVAFVIILLLALSISKRGAANETSETADNTIEEGETHSVGIARIYLDEPNYSPAAKDDVSRLWDRTLFYTLEDVDPTSDADGQISGYQLSKKQFLDGDSDRLIQYEIYRNPATGQIEKVISLKYVDGMADITDYYFQNEKLNFIFHRTDSVYTPTYATPKKPGQRFYFSEDHLIKSRDVWAPEQGIEWVVALEEKPTFPQTLYSQLSQTEQEAFDAEEKRWLNEAYNVLAAMKDYDGIGTVTGSVVDCDGNPIEGVSVALEWESDSGEDLFHATTDSAGIYTVYVPLSETEGVLALSREGYQEQRIYGIHMNEKTLTLAEPVVLLEDGTEGALPVTISFLDAETADPGSVTGSLVIRKGSENTQGDPEFNEEVTSGICSLSLAPGTYTAELQTDRYGTIYRTFLVKTNVEHNIRFYCVPTLPETAIWVTLEWDTPEDLDLCLFLPEWGADGDMKYVNAVSTDSGNGVRLIADGTGETGFERLTLDSLMPGSYKLYVSDYENAVGGNLSANALSSSNAVVRIYSAQGQIAEYYIPVNQPGVIWEVLEIQNGSIYPVQRCYSNIEGKTWWTEDKNAKDITELLVSGSWSDGDWRGYLSFGADGSTTSYENASPDCYYELNGNKLYIHGDYGDEYWLIEYIDENWLGLQAADANWNPTSEGVRYFFNELGSAGYVEDALKNGNGWIINDMSLADSFYGGIDFSDYGISLFYGAPERTDTMQWYTAATSMNGPIVAKDGIIQFYSSPEKIDKEWTYRLSGDSLYVNDGSAEYEFIRRPANYPPPES